MIGQTFSAARNPKSKTSLCEALKLEAREKPRSHTYRSDFTLPTMAPDSTPAKGGLSLYAHLLGPSSATSSTISGAPVTYKQPSEAQPEQDDTVKKQQALAGT
jgi:hypothetical protein